MNTSKKRKEIYCSHCYKTEGSFVKVSKTGDYQYYQCRECNTARLKKYRQTKKGKETMYKAIYKSIAKYKERQNARILLNYHVRVGHIKRPEQCECGNPKVEGHHTDYTKPLKVTWLCRTCHADLHRQETKV